jgi:hypothetical protein
VKAVAKKEKAPLGALRKGNPHGSNEDEAVQIIPFRIRDNAS